jgi:polyisoprenoid-binding protein YceI
MSAKTHTVVEPGVWRIDRTRSTVGFRIRHFGVATVRGHFQSFDARIEAGEHGLRVDGHVDVASVDTGNQIRDEPGGRSSSTPLVTPRSRCARAAPSACAAS